MKLDTDVLIIAPFAQKWEEQRAVPREAWLEMGKAGFLCPWLEPDYGGSGADFAYCAILREEMVVWDPYQLAGGVPLEKLKRAKVILWKGHCSVHQRFLPEHVDNVRGKYPGSSTCPRFTTLLISPSRSSWNVSSGLPMSGYSAVFQSPSTLFVSSVTISRSSPL